MKYILSQDTLGYLWPVIFPDHVTHSQIKVEGCKPHTAGFVDPFSGTPYGKSDSLKLESHPDDRLWLEIVLRGGSGELYMLNSDRASLRVNSCDSQAQS